MEPVFNDHDNRLLASRDLSSTRHVWEDLARDINTHQLQEGCYVTKNNFTKGDGKVSHITNVIIFRINISDFYLKNK